MEMRYAIIKIYAGEKPEKLEDVDESKWVAWSILNAPDAATQGAITLRVEDFKIVK